MDFVKRHLVFIICGVAALASVAFGAIGLSKMSGITGRMNASRVLLGELQSEEAQSTGGGAINPGAIEAAEKAVNECQANLKTIRDRAEELNRREPLVQDIFPTPQRRVLAYSFRSAYRQAIDDLPQTVMGGAKPSQVEIENWKMALEEQARRGESDTAAASGVSESIRLDPAARAAIDKARRIRCYAEPESFDVHNIYNATGAPSPEDMWQAQTALWIQQDVMEAIAAMNEAAAKKLSQGVTPCVLNLPVKHIVGIQTSDYLARDSARQAGRAPRAAAGGAVRPPPEDPSDVFTGRKPGRLFDLMYFRLRVVVEADKVLDLIARLSEKNLYTPIDIEMQDVEQSDDFHGYLYGPDPIVDLQVGFEACFLSSVYGKMVPREAGGEAPGGRGRARR